MQATADAAPDLTPGRKVRQAREALGLSREALAYESDVSTSTVARLELYERLPATLPLARIAARLQLRVDDLLPADLRVGT